MKNFFYILLLLPIICLGQNKSETSKDHVIEWNVGIASVDDYEFSSPFPGTSVLYTQTSQIGESGVFEWQIGIGLPSLITGKIVMGMGNLNNYIGISVRPWPLFVGPQLKIDNFSFSFEFGTNDIPSLESGLIATVGYRWNINQKFI